MQEDLDEKFNKGVRKDWHVLYWNDGYQVVQNVYDEDIIWCRKSIWKPGTGKVHWEEMEFNELPKHIREEALEELI